MLYLGNVAGAHNDFVDLILSNAIESSISVLPVVRKFEPDNIEEKLPHSIQFRKAVGWVDNKSVAIATLLQMLGLVESARKVFISYRHYDSKELAIQLHTALSQRGFDVFLDRFSVPPGKDFQERIDQELGDKAFVVLLESPGIQDSKWIQHEITYAHSHRIGILAVTKPCVAKCEQDSSVADAFRHRLCHADLTPEGKLKSAVLVTILNKIELGHARALRRRREQLIGSLRDILAWEGGCSRPLDDWAILASFPNGETSVFQITPRCPRPHDLFELHQIRTNLLPGTETGCGAVLVHAAGNICAEKKDLLDWIRDGKGMEVKFLQDGELS